MLHELDTDQDQRLSAPELQQPAFNLCRAYRRIAHDRRTSLTSLLRAASLPAASGGFEPAAFLRALHRAEAADALDAAVLTSARQAAEAKDARMSPSQAAAIASCVAPQPSARLISAESFSEPTSASSDDSSELGAIDRWPRLNPLA